VAVPPKIYRYRYRSSEGELPVVKKKGPGIYGHTKKEEVTNHRKTYLILGGVGLVAVLIALAIAFSTSGTHQFIFSKDKTADDQKTEDTTKTAYTAQELKTYQASAKALRGSGQQVTIDTAKGQIVIEIYPKLMPKTVANFNKLVDKKFYDGLTFHRVEDWVVQGGDPEGTGSGGPGWTIALETNTKLLNLRGAVGMARSTEPDSAGSQFYILKANEPVLDGQYAIFGQVIKGMDVVDKLQQGAKMTKVRE
jgi:peptidyl-prolyl cis-trans isomerase B (cyclophilin B)